MKQFVQKPRTDGKSVPCPVIRCSERNKTQRRPHQPLPKIIWEPTKPEQPSLTPFHSTYDFAPLQFRDKIRPLLVRNCLKYPPDGKTCDCKYVRNTEPSGYSRAAHTNPDGKKRRENPNSLSNAP